MTPGPNATKYIFVTGGVVSSLGKGIAAASLGRLLVERGLSVTMQKFDPYINVDPGTMSPFQHGEVFVTDDGAETDLDLGHYERFIDRSLSQQNNVTTGRIYQIGHQQGAAGRVPRQHGAGHPAHHRRDQERDPAHRAGARRGDHRDRRHRRRHRVAAVPRGDPAVPPGGRPRQRPVHPPHAGALHRGGGRAQDQADPALGPRADADRNPARHPHLPQRAADLRRHQAQDRALLQRGLRLRGREPGRGLDLRDPAPLPRPGTRPGGLRAAPAGRPGSPISPPGRRWSARMLRPSAQGAHRGGREVHRARTTPTSRSRRR